VGSGRAQSRCQQVRKASFQGQVRLSLRTRLFAREAAQGDAAHSQKAAHPVRTATRAMTPEPAKRLQRAAHALGLAEMKAEDAVVDTVRGERSRR
jgi:hypothetical protein